MATPRKNWFKVPDSICFDALTNDELACLVRLQAYMNTRWARDGKNASERGKCVIDARMAMTISGKHRPDVALTSLRHLADITSMSARCEGDIVSIDWPKYADFQAMDARESPLPSPISKPSPSQEEKREHAPPAPVAGAPPRAPRREVVEKPENFPDESRERLRKWGDSKGFGRDLMNAGLERFREWEPQKPPYRRTFKQWEGSFKKIVREGVAAGMIGKPEGKAKPAYKRDDTGQVLVPNEWRGLAG